MIRRRRCPVAGSHKGSGLRGAAARGRGGSHGVWRSHRGTCCAADARHAPAGRPDPNRRARRPARSRISHARTHDPPPPRASQAPDVPPHALELVFARGGFIEAEYAAEDVALCVGDVDAVDLCLEGLCFRGGLLGVWLCLRGRIGRGCWYGCRCGGACGLGERGGESGVRPGEERAEEGAREGEGGVQSEGGECCGEDFAGGDGRRG